MAAERFRISIAAERGRSGLKVLADTLEMGDLEPFEAACKQLLATTQPVMIIDLRGISTIHSAFIGVLLFVHAEADLADRQLLVAADPKVLDLLMKLTRGVLRIYGQ